MGDSTPVSDTRIAISSETRDRLRALKRGGETYDQLLRKMERQYEPEEVSPRA